MPHILVVGSVNVDLQAREAVAAAATSLFRVLANSVVAGWNSVVRRAWCSFTAHQPVGPRASSFGAMVRAEINPICSEDCVALCEASLPATIDDEGLANAAAANPFVLPRLHPGVRRRRSLDTLVVRTVSGGNGGSRGWRSDNGRFRQPGLYPVYAPALVINRLLYPKLAYDSTQFVPMTVIGAIPNVLLVHPKVSAETVAELIAFAKATPASSTTPRRATAPPRTSPQSCSSRRLAACRSFTFPTKAPLPHSPAFSADRWT